MTNEDIGDFHPFSSMRGVDLPAEMVICRRLLNGMAALEESQTLTVQEKVTALVGLLGDALYFLEADLVQLKRRLGQS